MAFLSGLRSLAPDMKQTCDRYMDEKNFMDIQVLSSLGLSEEDIRDFCRQPGIEEGEGVYMIDAFAGTPGLDIVAKVWSMPKDLNKITVDEGRAPKAMNECAVDKQIIKQLGVKVGDTIKLKTEGDFEDGLREEEFTIVGRVTSPYYISTERGSSTLGNGQVAAFVYVPRKSFNMASYTAGFFTVSGAKELSAFYDEYTDRIDDVIDSLESYGEKRAAIREKTVREDAYSDIERAESVIANARKKLDDAKTQLDDARKELDDGWAKYKKSKVKIESIEQRLADAEAEYADGLAEFTEKKADAEADIAKAEADIADAKKEIEDIPECEFYILSRDSNPGYLGFGQDADRMGNLAKVLPLLFYAVAALVCLTTMTRMVDEQRIQIGSLKAIGYSPFAISAKYILYGTLPAFIGSIIGLAVGCTLFPVMVFTAYQIMYEVPDIILSQHTDITVFSIIASICCTGAVTLAACLSALRAVPAVLMRPKTPAAGKRVFLEYVTPLWKRLSFFAKVTVRNLFRYKKRFFMTVVGIGGCTALIIAAWGIRSSLLATMERQFEDIYSYTAQISLASNISEDELNEVIDYVQNEPEIEDSLFCNLSTGTAESDDYSIFAFSQVVDPDRIGCFVDLHDYKTKEPIKLTDDGVVINQKLSELLNIGVGDSFVFDCDGRSTLKVAAITEHYIAHYIYMTPAYYEASFGEKYAPNGALMKFSDDTAELCSRLFEDMMHLDGVSSATRISDTRGTYQSQMEIVDYVIVVVIMCAAALAVIVLYNLCNINITERKRELATIRLLGFYDTEVSAYIVRENFVLTVFGIAFGMLLGHLLHTWLVLSVEIDLMMFGRDTSLSSYVYAGILTAVFSVVVNLMAHYKMKKIDMVSSLKSPE